jgi:putative acetyltransferase
MSGLRIEIDDLTRPAVHALLEEHLADMYAWSPPESVHALDLEGLRRPEVTFWSAWSERGELLGCGALKEIDPRHAEIKSMRTANAHRGKGVGRQLLRHLLAVARERGYRRLSLETGAQPGFEPARRLYEAFGFRYTAPFEGYVEDPNSVFMTLGFDGELP